MCWMVSQDWWGFAFFTVICISLSSYFGVFTYTDDGKRQNLKKMNLVLLPRYFVVFISLVIRSYLNGTEYGILFGWYIPAMVFFVFKYFDTKYSMKRTFIFFNSSLDMWMWRMSIFKTTFLYVFACVVVYFYTFNLLNIICFYVLRILKLDPKPIVIISRGSHVAGHWFVAVGRRTFELFKQRCNEEGKELKSDYDDDDVKKNMKFEAIQQRHGRRDVKELGFFNFLYIPLMNRGLVGYYFGTNISLQKKYQETFEKHVIKRGEYKVLSNDCQVFCSCFCKELGIDIITSAGAGYTTVLSAIFLSSVIKYFVFGDNLFW